MLPLNSKPKLQEHYNSCERKLNSMSDALDTAWRKKRGLQKRYLKKVQLDDEPAFDDGLFNCIFTEGI